MKKPKNPNPKEEKNSVTPPPSRKRRTRYVWLNVLPGVLWLKVRRGETIWKAMQDSDVELGGDCGGLGKCGKCKVRVLSAIHPPTREERELLDEEELQQGVRLACRTHMNEDLVISTEETVAEIEYSQILTTSHILKNRYMPISRLEPLVDKQLVTLPNDIQNEGISDLDQIKLVLGSEYKDLKASLYCLRTLPDMLKRTRAHGGAVFHDNCLIAWQDAEEMHHHFGLVFDIGTTTLVGKLISLENGSEVAVASCLNSQSRRGADVISRLHFIKEHPQGLESLNHLLINDLNQLTIHILKTAGLEPDDIFVTVAAGNTTMQHLLLGLSPAGIAEAPFSPVLIDGLVVRAADVGLHLHPSARLYTMPMKSGYIGGDLISDILTSGAAEQEDEIILGLDLGTNGEIFLGNSKRMMTCSAAAGPALEGAKISEGMIAKTGAIQGVSFEEGDIHYLVVGNVQPRGICGSGLVELVSILLRVGIIDNEGLIRHTEKRTAQGLNSRLIDRSGVYDYLIASAEESYDHKPLYLTQKDVRELQLAKGAIAAGIKTLTDEMGIKPEDIDRVYLAGALGNYITPYSAMRIGLIPRLDPESIRSLGNAATMGASMVLLSRNYWQKAKEISDFIEHIELSSRLDFNQHFIEQIDFPREVEADMIREDIDYRVMRTIKVKEIMTSDFLTVPSTMRLEEMSNILRDTGYRGLPVLDEEGCLFGMVTLIDLEHSLPRSNAELKVGNIATKELFVAYDDQSLSDVIKAIPKSYGRIPVVDRHDNKRMVGILRRRDIIKVYRKRVAEAGKSRMAGIGRKKKQ